MFQEQKGGRLSQFARYVRQFGGGLQQVIEDAKDGATIFAPSNEAFDPAIRYRTFFSSNLFSSHSLPLFDGGLTHLRLRESSMCV